MSESVQPDSQPVQPTFPPRGSTVPAGLKFAAGLADRSLDEFAGRLKSIVTVLTLSIGGAFLFVFLPRAIFLEASTPGGVMATSIFAAVAIAAGLYVDAQGTGGWGSWALRTLGLGAAIAVVTTLFALGIGQPAGWVVSAILLVAFFFERLYMRVTSVIVEKSRVLAGGMASKMITMTLGDKVDDKTRDEIRRIIQDGRQ